jgi:hypothetical protein
MANELPGKWLDLQLWSLREAAYLLSGREPDDEATFMIEMHTASDVALVYRDLKDATLAGALKFTEVDGLLMRRRVIPAHAVAWSRHRAQGRGLRIPEFLNATTGKAEDAIARQRRRLARLRELDGDMRPAGTGWHTTGRKGALTDLVREERAAGRPRSDKSDVRRDLIAAVEANRGS